MTAAVTQRPIGSSINHLKIQSEFEDISRAINDLDLRALRRILTDPDTSNYVFIAQSETGCNLFHQWLYRVSLEENRCELITCFMSELIQILEKKIEQYRHAPLLLAELHACIQISLNQPTKLGCLPLDGMIAYRSPPHEILALIELGAGLNWDQASEFLYILAQEREYYPILERVIDREKLDEALSRPKCGTRRHPPILHGAAETSNANAIRLLLSYATDRSALVEQIGDRGKTALHLAAAVGDEATVLALKAGYFNEESFFNAAFIQKDEDGNTPFEILEDMNESLAKTLVQQYNQRRACTCQVS